MLHEESYLALCYHMAADKPSGFCLGLEQYSNYLLTRFHKKKGMIRLKLYETPNCK